MLGRLIQTAASYGKSNASLESATEEAHTRNLLYGQSQHVYSLAQSPPSSPFAGPTFRPGSFDDRGGLELEEKDLRLIIAQDAYGAEEKPMVLFDSNTTTSTTQTSPSHIRHGSTTQAGPRSPLPTDWRPGAATSLGKAQADIPFRNRSSTISGAPTAWTRQLRDTSTKEEALLECMFGVTSSTKATSTIKMHIIPGKPRQGSSGAGRESGVSETNDSTARRMPLARSRTANMSPRVQLPPLTMLDTTSSHDAILITRLFHVPLPESVGTRDQNEAPSPVDNIVGHENGNTNSTESGTSKKPKLIERKVPAFAIGLVLHLPRIPLNRPASTRPASRAAHGHSLSSTSGSFGSDIQNSWAFSNAIPEVLYTSRYTINDTDKRIDVIVNNWEIILRAISALEHEATSVIYEQLEKTLHQVAGPSQKVPKEKSMQRINQRVISITNPSSVAECVSLTTACKHAIRRICYALRVPRVVTGLGFAAGHWPDEARTLYRICGRRHQNFFLFTLLTAFLGNHTQWLQRLAPDWYRRQFRASHKLRSERYALAPRTIIVSDQRTIARRLIYVLASFLPASSGLDGLQKVGEDFALSSRLSTSSPSSQLPRMESLRRTANKKLRDHRLQSTSNDKSLLSTSASSTDSITPYGTQDRPHRYLVRKDSDALSIRAMSAAIHPDADAKKTSAGTASVISPNPTTPVAYFSIKHDSYFPEGVLADTNESIASADLAKILRRSSSSADNSSNVSSRWGSLMSGISDLWGQKPALPGEYGVHTPQTPSESYLNRRVHQPRTIKSEAADRPTTVETNHIDISTNSARRADATSQMEQKGITDSELQSPLKPLMPAPKLKVDDKDGVIDVDMDWPGFPNFANEGTLFSPSRKPNRPSNVSAGDGNESVRSLRSIPTLSPRAPVAEETSVAGFLRRHHQDFAVQAVRPYAALDDDIKRSMSMEPSPVIEDMSRSNVTSNEDWAEICTTIVADVRTFTIRRLVLRRKIHARPQDEYHDLPHESHEPHTRLTPRAAFSKVEEELIEEDVKDFDVTLADAVERVLNLAEALQPHPPQSPRQRHVRTLSTSTTHSTRTTAPDVFDNSMLGITQEYVKQDCRQVIIGALEEIVKDVTNDLDRLHKGRAIQEVRRSTHDPVPKDTKQDNLLREGVRKWLQEVDDMRLVV